MEVLLSGSNKKYKQTNLVGTNYATSDGIDFHLVCRLLFLLEVPGKYDAFILRWIHLLINQTTEVEKLHYKCIVCTAENWSV